MIARGVQLSRNIQGNSAAVRIFRQSGDRLRAAQDVMTRSQALLTGPSRDRIQALAIKEELASTRSSLEDSSKDIEKQMEDLRKRRQETSNAFENFDQKANQLFNILSTVLKTMKEQTQAIVRNPL